MNKDFSPKIFPQGSILVDPVLYITLRGALHDQVEALVSVYHLKQSNDTGVTQSLHTGHLSGDNFTTLIVKLGFINDFYCNMFCKMLRYHTKCNGNSVNYARDGPFVSRCSPSFTLAKFPTPSCFLILYRPILFPLLMSCRVFGSISSVSFSNRVRYFSAPVAIVVSASDSCQAYTTSRHGH